MSVAVAQPGFPGRLGLPLVLGDGMLIGLSAALDPGAGLLFAIAPAPEMGLLGVTTAEGPGKRWPEARIIGTAAVAC